MSNNYQDIEQLRAELRIIAQKIEILEKAAAQDGLKLQQEEMVPTTTESTVAPMAPVTSGEHVAPVFVSQETKVEKPKEVYLAKHPAGVIGKIEIDREQRVVYVSSEANAQMWGTGFGGMPRIQILNLMDFSEGVSGIPWIRLSESIRGYTIRLLWVRVKDAQDRACENWFNSLNCKVVVII